MRREVVLVVGRILSTVALSLALAVPAISAQEEEADAWPRNRDALVFLFATAFDPILAYSADGGEPVFNYSLEPQGRARVSSSGALELARGTFTALGVGESLRRSIAESSSRAMTLELFLHTGSPSQSKRETFLELGSSPPLLSLSQEGRGVVLRLRATEADSSLVLRAPLRDKNGHHVALTMDSQGVALFVDGREQARRKTDFLEDPARLAELDHLVLGSGSSSSVGWGGRLEGVALYSRILGAAEIRDSANVYGRLVDVREPIPALSLSGRLLQKSHVPTLEELAPYRRSLAVFEYEVLEVTEGFYLLDQIRIAHWVILDREPLPVGETRPGTVIELMVEPFAENRQLENVNISDTLPLDFDLDLFFSVGVPN